MLLDITPDLHHFWESSRCTTSSLCSGNSYQATGNITTWKVSAPIGGANPHSFVPTQKIDYVKTPALQGF